jgi:hypothetical protein
LGEGIRVIFIIDTEIHIGQEGIAMEVLQEAENEFVKIAEK